MKLHIRLLHFIGFCLFASGSLAQNPLEEVIATLDELNDVQVFADQKRVADWSGVRRDIKLSDFSVAFDTAAGKKKEYHSALIISKARVTLLRHNKYTAISFGRPGGTEPMNTLYAMAQPGDRYELELTLVARRKTGEYVPLKTKLIRNFPLL